MVLMVVGMPNQPPGSGESDSLDAEPQEDWESAPKTPEEVWAVITGLAEGEGDDIDAEIASFAADIIGRIAEPDPAVAADVDVGASTVPD